MAHLNPLSLLFSAIGAVPLRILYVISSALAFVLHRVMKYRVKVVRENLTSSFPEKSEKELRRIERDFYHFLTDYFVETMRLGCMSRREIERRMRFENTEEVNRCLSEGKDVTLYLGHYCNWEWVSSIPLHITVPAKGGQIYHPLENKMADEAFLKIRERFGGISIPMAQTLHVLLGWRRAGERSIVGYIADQAPGYRSMHYFADFLHHDTGAFTGPERISRMLHTAVFYCDMSRPRRGEYVCRYVRMSDDAASLPPFELTRLYYQMLEQTIRRAPQYWLWSHKRWKRTRAGLYETLGEEEATRVLSKP